jgi:hypothetical protein
MADQTVRIEPTDKAYTALRLMEFIAARTAQDADVKKKEYWIKLYCQCWEATNGNDPSTILKMP